MKKVRIHSWFFVFICFCIFDPAYVYAQKTNNHIVDSLQSVLSQRKSDTQRIKILGELINELTCENAVDKINYLKEFISITSRIGNIEKTPIAFRILGDVYVQCEYDYDKAISLYDSGIIICRLLNDVREEAELYMSTALAYRNKKEHSKALAYYNKSITTDTTPSNVKSALANIGAIYSSIGDYPHAAVYLEKAYNLQHRDLITNKSSNKDDTLMLMSILISIADVEIIRSQYTNALNNYQKLMDFNRYIKFSRLDMMALMGMGQCHSLMNEYPAAIENYTKALEISKQNSDEVDGSIILNELGNIHLDEGDDEKAMEYAQKALAITEGTNTRAKANLPGTYQLLGKIYTHRRQYATAVTYLQKAVSLYHSAQQMDEESKAWGALSNTYQQMGKPTDALIAYKQFINLRDSVYSQEKARQITSITMQGEFDRKQAADSLRQADEKKITTLKMQRQKALTYSGFAGVALLLLLAFFIYRNYNNERKANVIISRASDSLKSEKLVSEKLLLNILPADVAEELKARGSVAARQFDNVTVLFTDFIGFTSSSERLTPGELVAELHECFKAFDAIMKKYNVEKIKTAGDAYLAVSGLPAPNPNHATDIIYAAMEVRDFMIARRKQLGDKTFGIRLGLNSGSVVAGIVGDTKFAYDIWGDTVNTAARMEQNSDNGRINISPATYELVKDTFVCEYRGELEAKGKGAMKMYFVG